MYFSAKELHAHVLRKNESYRNSVHRNFLAIAFPQEATLPGGYFNTELQTRYPFSLNLVQVVLRTAKAKIANRDHDNYKYGKWYRPWDVVPKLRNWSAPEGDFGVGIEVEMGFQSREAAARIAHAVKNWKYITLDFEGGTHPIEATFPPTCYSKFGDKSQAVRYVKLLQENADLVVHHDESSMVGTHVNVSKGGVGSYSNDRIEYVNHVISYHLSHEQKRRFFGRSRPYGLINNQDRFMEMKMFNSTIDPEAVKRYVNVAVSLAKLITSTDTINNDSVVAALETGYNGRISLN